MNGTGNNKREVMLNCRFDFSEAMKIEKFMHRHGYTNRSQLIRDALLKDRFTTYIHSEITDIESAIDLFEALENVRKQVNRVVSNTIQVAKKFEYFTFLDRLLSGIFDFDINKHNQAKREILIPAVTLIGEFVSLCNAAGPVFLDERIMKNEIDMTTEIQDPAALRLEYKASGTTVERKLEIIRTLFNDGHRNYIPTPDKELYTKLFKARWTHDTFLIDPEDVENECNE